MKQTYSFFLPGCFLLLFLFSCKKVENFLDKAPGVDIDENRIFSSRVETERLVATMYQLGMPSIYPLRPADTGVPITGAAQTNATTFTITDEADASESYAYTQAWNNGSINATNIYRNEDHRYFVRWQAIRVANIMLERIADVPTDDAYKTMVRGEALFIRAVNNFETLKRYGGFPLIMKRVVEIEEAKIPRNTVEECVNAIVKDCNDAVALLPVVQPSNFTGRVTKGAALALKSRTLLFAASPLFNTATPYVSFGSAQDDKLLCYGNVDANRWKLAADAAKAVLDWADGAGVALIDDPARRIPNIVPGQKVDGNYRTAWEQHDNAEIILANKTWGGAKSVTSFPWQHVVPRNEHVPNAGGFWIGTTVTFNHIRKYEKRDGTPQTWNLAGGDDLLQKYSELDPRFAQSVAYTGARLHNNATRLQIWQGAPSNKNNCRGGAWMLKGVNDGIGTASQIPNVPVFRLNEVYLNYAEALNEFEGAPSQAAYNAVNRIRERSGMPPLPQGLNKEQFRARVRNERAIELAFEDIRFWDIRRWMIAEENGVMTGDMWGLEIQRLNNATPFPTAFSYKPYVFEPRVFPRKLYLHPFDETEVLKGSIKQNPGW